VGDINCPEVVSHLKKPPSLSTWASLSSLATPPEKSSSGSELSLQLDSSSHLYTLLAPFPQSVSAQISPLSEDTVQREKEQGNAKRGAFGVQGLLSWGAEEESTGSQSGSGSRASSGSASTGRGTAELVVGASCLERKQSASQVLEAFRQFPEDVLIVGDLVESQILHPLLAGGKVEHLFEVLATSMVEECSWTVLVPAPCLHALSRDSNHRPRNPPPLPLLPPKAPGVPAALPRGLQGPIGSGGEGDLGPPSGVRPRACTHQPGS